MSISKVIRAVVPLQVRNIYTEFVSFFSKYREYNNLSTCPSWNIELSKKTYTETDDV